MSNYIRRKSTALDVARSRWQGLVSRDEAMDLGNGLGVQAYQSSIEAFEAQLLKVNNLAAENQTERAKLREMERELRDLNDRYFKGTAAKYGTSSMEYMAIGGIPKKQRRRPMFNKMSSPSAVSGDQ